MRDSNKKLYQLIIVILIILFLISLMQIKHGTSKLKFIDPLLNYTADIIPNAYQGLKSLYYAGILTGSEQIDFNIKPVDIVNYVDDGYLLLSLYNPNLSQNIIRLIKLENNEVIYQWIPKLADFFKKKFPNLSKDELNKKVELFRLQHPLIDQNGFIYTNGPGELIKINPCGEVVDYNNDFYFHHSLNFNKDKSKIYVPATDYETKLNFLNRQITNEGFAVIDVSNMQVVQFVSLIEILKKNNFLDELNHSFLYNQNDIIHLNDVEPILEDDKYFTTNHIAFSSRHLSSVFLLDLLSEKIIFYKNYPLLANHDIDYQGDGIFSIFNNNYFIPPKGKAHNDDKMLVDILFYDFKTDSFYSPYKDSLNKIKAITAVQGSHTVIGDDIIIEPNDERYVARISKSDIKWKKYFTLNNSAATQTHWHRYFSSDKEIEDFIKNLSCNN